MARRKRLADAFLKGQLSDVMQDATGPAGIPVFCKGDLREKQLTL